MAQKKKQKKNGIDRRRLLVMILAGVMALLLIVPLLAMALSAGAVTQSDIDKLKKNASSLASQKKDVQSQLTQLQKDKNKALEQKNALDQQISLIEDEIENQNEQIEAYEGLITQTEADLADAEAREAEEYATFLKRVRAMEESGSEAASYLSVLFGATSFSDFLDRVNFVSDVVAYDNAVMDELAATREEIAAHKTELETDKQGLEDARAELLVRQDELTSRQAEAWDTIDKLADDTEAAQATLKKILADEDAVQEKIDTLTKQLEEELAKKNQTIVSESGYLWPLTGYTKITSTYGMRLHPIYKVMRMHTGVDVAAAAGTPILASRSGQVLIAEYNSSYGNYVVISHGNGDTTLYAHMKKLGTKAGATVKQGDTIGYVGSTGDSTGNHLHFEVKVNGSRIDPLTCFSNITFTYS
ncbi:MAG TPA: peptidoglycan DD-metalloendopeptidase family protein [Oscillospiraceae bacterium]|nr:peptidoglycan DD-metalloendopeptidase family protein [Oscillospiraceae bacterium]